MILYKGGLVDLSSDLTRTGTSERDQAARVIARALRRQPERNVREEGDDFGGFDEKGVS